MAAIKALFVLPLSALAVVAFASEKITSGMEVISNAKITEIFTQDTIKIAPKKEVKVKVNTAKQENSEGQVKGEKPVNSEVKMIYNIRVNDENSDNTSISKVITYSIKDTINVTIAGKDTAKAGFRTAYIRVNNADTKDTIRTFVTFMDEKNSNATPLCIIDGKEEEVRVMKSLDPRAIQNISVLKDKAAIDIYGDKGKNGVIVITLKSVSAGRSPEDSQTVIIRGMKHNNDVLYVVDGKVMDPKDALEINPDQIKSLSILKGDKAKEKYGDKVKKGVIEITLNK